MLFLKKQTEFNVELTVEKKRKAFLGESLLKQLNALFQCYRFINRHFFKKCFY